jgi:hypothetical protein
MSRVYAPVLCVEQWAQLLAQPEKQWRVGFSARTLAHAWQEATGFPGEVQAVLSRSPNLNGIELLLALPEHQVPVPGGSRPSQSDIWVLARAHSQLVSLAVEGKVSEPFGPTIREWLDDPSRGKKKRLAYLCSELGLGASPPGDIRYQLLHRAASAMIEARRFMASHAVMLVHSFSPCDEWFQDYADFVALFGATPFPNEVASVRPRNSISLHFAWVRGDAQYRSR